MHRRGITLLETIIAISITSVIGVAIVSMMAAAADGLSSKDDGRKSAIRLATTKVRLSAYIAPSRCILERSPSSISLWLNDSRQSNTVHASEVRWIQYLSGTNELVVKFVSFPKGWSQSMIDAADTECTLLTDYQTLLSTFENRGLIDTIPLVNSIASCTFWVNDSVPSDATMVSSRYSLLSEYGVTHDAMIDETLRLHQPPLE